MVLKLCFPVLILMVMQSCVKVHHVTPMGHTARDDERNLTVGNRISQHSHDHNVTEVEAEGTGSDRENAIRDAQRNAIATAVGTYLTSEQEMQNYMTVRDQILAKSEGFVKSYQVIDQVRESDGSWTVKIFAAVSKDILMDDLEALGILLSQLGNPSIVVFYAPRGVPYDQRFTEQAINQINQYFTTHRYSVYDLDQLNAMIEADLMMKEASIGEDIDMAQILAKQLKADIYVTVSLILEEVAHGVKKAKATARIFNASTAQLLGVQNGYSDEIYGNVTAHDANIDQAVKKLMPPMMNQVKGFWREQLDKGRRFVLLFSNLPPGRQTRAVMTEVLQAGAREVKRISNEQFEVWLTVPIDDYFIRIGDDIQNRIYQGTDFDYSNRGDRIDIFPLVKSSE